jgi:hypothetical protein
MTIEEINRIKMLEKTKDMLVCKLEKVTSKGLTTTMEEAQAQIDELT